MLLVHGDWRSVADDEWIGRLWRQRGTSIEKDGGPEDRRKVVVARRMVLGDGEVLLGSLNGGLARCAWASIAKLGEV